MSTEQHGRAEPDSEPTSATLARRSDAMLADMHARVRAALDEGSGVIARSPAILDQQAEAVMAVVEDEAINRMAEQFVAESRMRALEVRNGTVHLEAFPAREIVAMWIGASRTMIGDAENYIEMDVQLAETGEGYTFHLSRRGKLTPHQARKQAEARAEAAEAKLAAIESLRGSRVYLDVEDDNLHLAGPCTDTIGCLWGRRVPAESGALLGALIDAAAEHTGPEADEIHARLAEMQEEARGD